MGGLEGEFIPEKWSPYRLRSLPIEGGPAPGCGRTEGDSAKGLRAAA